MKLPILGIHHISVIAQQPQENVEFYTGVLGLRLVKNTLNYDDMSMYHFYYGNEDASGNLSTFFPIPSSEEGVVGTGQVAYQTYLVPKGSFDFWSKRLESFKVPYYFMNRHGRRYLVFKDPHGYELEMVETMNSSLPNPWEFNGVDAQVGIQSILSAGLYSSDISSTHTLLTEIFGYKQVGLDGGMRLYRLHDGIDGELEIRDTMATPGKRGYGTVHHIALRVHDGDIDAWRDHLIDLGYQPTEVRERQYFRAIYFRDRGGILFELSTESPGMTVDESVEKLGTELLIPKHYEAYREEILSRLVPVSVRPIDKLQTYSYRNLNEYEFIQKRQAILEEINAIKQKETLTQDDEKRLDTLRKEYRDSREDLK